jgi:hypothetical protein
MNRNENVQLDARIVPSLEEAIDQWLAARDNFMMRSTDENQHEYKAIEPIPKRKIQASLLLEAILLLSFNLV